MTDVVLECRNVSHSFRDKRVLQHINLQVAAGQFVSLVGPSGCGKSTLLRAILGTHPPTQGQVLVEGVPVTRPCRDVGIVYQDYSLYEYMRARDNVAFGLMLDQTSLPFRFFRPLEWYRLQKDFRRRADELLEKVNLKQAVRLFPSEMSGGMRQRVAIAQALIMQPKILLLDEPFGALDEATREELQMMLLQLYDENVQAVRQGRRPPYTILIVTHELNEALFVAERVVGLSQYHDAGADGATIVYDKAAPIFRPGDPRDAAKLEAQKDELRHAVFDPDYIKSHTQYVTYWQENTPPGVPV